MYTPEHHIQFTGGRGQCICLVSPILAQGLFTRHAQESAFDTGLLNNYKLVKASRCYFHYGYFINIYQVAIKMLFECPPFLGDGYLRVPSWQKWQTARTTDVLAVFSLRQPRELGSTTITKGTYGTCDG